MRWRMSVKTGLGKRKRQLPAFNYTRHFLRSLAQRPAGRPADLKDPPSD